MNTARIWTARALWVIESVVSAVALVALGGAAIQVIVYHDPAPVGMVLAVVGVGITASTIFAALGDWASPTEPRQRPVERLTRAFLASIGITAATAAAGLGYMVAILGEEQVRQDARLAATLAVVAGTFGLARLIGGWLARRTGLIPEDCDCTEANTHEPVTAGQPS